MDRAKQVVLTVLGAIVTLAIISVVISKRSDTPQVIQAGASALGNVVAAAVSPVSTAATNGNLGLSTFTTPSQPQQGPGFLSGFLSSNPFGNFLSSQ